MDIVLNIEDLHLKAKSILPPYAYDYYASGARDENTLKDNIEAYSRIKIIPRCLVGNLSKIDTTCQILHETISFPIMVAPTAMHKMAHMDGEIGTYKAAQSLGTLYCLSNLATTSLSDIADVGIDKRWFQLYVSNDKTYAHKLVQKAEKFGYQALVITVDTPILGVRYKDLRNGFTLPEGLKLENFETTDVHLPSDQGVSGLELFMKTQIDINLNWQDIKKIVSLTSLPVVLKGSEKFKEI